MAGTESIFVDGNGSAEKRPGTVRHDCTNSFSACATGAKSQW